MADSVISLVASWGSSVYSAATAPVAKEFHVGSVVAILGLTLYICGKVENAL